MPRFHFRRGPASFSPAGMAGERVLVLLLVVGAVAEASSSAAGRDGRSFRQSIIELRKPRWAWIGKTVLMN